ncbi:ABC transporter substrate-binding protein [Desulfogranum marinum]|uniref:ABC transporter substrate-binding protein n=1 Tax=Desulfogranum marinum TaxID=453220 RepID=UPI0029C99652|nr:ABC transporter substrate-binding protein [Desulfogranum marinum]
MLTRKLSICALIAIVFLLWSCDSTPPPITPSGTSVKIAVIGSFSGDDSHMGESGLRGVKTALAIQPLLTNGDKIELVTLDDASSPSSIERIIKELVTEKFAAILLLSRSEIALELVASIKTINLPVIATVATHPDLTSDNDLFIQLSFDDNFQGTVAAMFARDELLAERAAVFSQPASPHSKHLADTFIRTFENAGGKLIAHTKLGDTPVDLPATLEWLSQQKADIIYLPVQTEVLLNLAKTAQQIDWAVQAIGSDGLLSHFLLTQKEHIDLIDGIMATDVYSSEILVTETGKKAIATYDSLFDDAGTTFAALGIEGMTLLGKAMNTCPELADSQCLLDTLHSGITFEGMMTTITITSDGKAVRPVYINGIQDGRLIFIAKVN